MMPFFPAGVVELLDTARRTSARAVNSIMTATYWEIGRRIVEFEQGGEQRAEYGESLLLRLSGDLTSRFGKGFGKSNLFLMRKFYVASAHIFQTASGELGSHAGESPIFQTLSGISGSKQIRPTLSAKSPPFALTDLARAFPRPWSHYVELTGHSRSHEAFAF